MARLDHLLGAAPERRLGAQVGLGEHARQEPVLEIVLVVGRGVAQVDDLGLEAGGGVARLQVLRPVALALVLEQARAHLVGQVEAGMLGGASLQAVHHPEHLCVVAEAAVPLHQAVEGHLAAVTEGRVPEVVPQGEGLAQGLVQPQGSADAARDLTDLEAVGEARAVVVTLLVEEDLGLVHQAPERRGVRDPVAVALVDRPHGVLVLGGTPSA